MSMLDFANANIPSPDGITELEHNDGDTSDIINVILKQDDLLGNYMCDFAQAYTPDYSGLNALWNFTHKYIKYVADQPGHEIVKDPRVTWIHRSGDCKSFSIFIASVLRCLGIPYRYRFAAYSPGDPTHVYVIAKINNQDVIMDATIDRFNHEITYHKKYDKVVKITRMHGAPKSIKKAPSINTKAKPNAAQRIANAPRIVIPQPYIDYSNLTEGLVTLRLLDENAQILSAYYGDEFGYYQKVRNYIYNASKNLHSLSGHIGYVDSQFYNLFAYIEYAKERSKPAGIASARIGDFATDRASLLAECKYIQDSFDGFLEARARGTATPRRRDGKIWDFQELTALNNKCRDQVFFIDAFNKHLEGTSPHLLYEFIPNGELNSLPGTANFKANNHRLANSSMARYSQLDRANIVLWERNGIMRRSAAAGLPEISPEAFINEWRKGKENINGAHIGIPFAVLAPIIVAALGAAKSILTLILTKQAAFASELKGFSSTQFGPEGDDFNKNGIPDGVEPPKPGFDFNSLLPIGAVALGGLLLLNSK